MQTLKRIDPLSLGTLLGITHTCLGVILVPIFFLLGGLDVDVAKAVGGVIALFASAMKDSGMSDGARIVAWVILLPFFYGITGFTSGVVSASIYNFVSSWFGGGIKIELGAMSASDS
jgi:hypothetical protein